MNHNNSTHDPIALGAPGQRCAVGDLLRAWARQRPERLCCALDDHEFTFAELDARADQLAAGLAALGIRKGDRVATLAPNRVEILELLYGLARSGAIQVPLNAYLKGAFLEHQLAHSRATVLIVDDAGRRALDPLLDRLPDLETVILLDEPAREIHKAGTSKLPYEAVLASEAAPPEVRIAPQDTMSIVYTSGTTGLPKGCVLSHGYYCRSGEVNAWALELTDEDILFCGLPLFHAGGRLIVVMTALYRGIPARIESSFSASRFIARAAATRATVAIGVGAMGAALLAAKPGDYDRHHHLRTMMTTPMAVDAQQRFKERFGIEPWTDLFGQTECMPITCTPLSSSQRDRSGCGIPATDLELRLLDDHGHEVGDSEMGEICVRATHERFAMFDGYWTKDGTTADPREHGWHHTGDYGRRRPSGSLMFVDRKKDSLRRRGENVSSLELEAAINEHPAIRECAVHAVPSQLAEDDIKVCVVLGDNEALEPDAFFAFLKERVPYFAIPRYVEILDELPRNAVGRVMKHVLRERAISDDVWDFELLGHVIERAERR
jgi:crotonobetaine/carnitine-CoA ligase